MAKKIGGLGKGLGAIFIENDAEDGNATVTLKITEIEPNHHQPRQSFDRESLEQLAQSIKEHGLIQPILVKPILGGGYRIVAGERRYRACRMAGLTDIPVTIRELDDRETMEIALIENLQRENLNPLEEALGYQRLMEEYNLSQEQAAAAVGKSRPAVANTLRLLKLPEEARELVKEGKLSAGHARALLSIEDKDEIIRLARMIVREGLSVRQAEKLAGQKPKRAAVQKPSKKPTYYSMVEQTLTEYLGRKTKVEPLKDKKGGVLQIEFYSDEELKELASKLEEK